MTQGDRDDLPAELLASLLESLAPMDPSPALRARVLARVARAPGPCEGIVTLRAAQGCWIEFLPRIRIKPLHDDGETRTWLARMDAGAVVPPHGHEKDEECYVLEGTIDIGGVELHAGDHQVAKAGSRHGVVTTRTGCLVLMRTGSVDRELAALGA